MSVKLYYDFLSQPSRVLYIFFKVCNIPFEPNPVKLRKFEHHSPEYEKIHRFKKVPAIDHNGFKLIESVGIMRYICREFNVPDHWYPSESKRQAKVDEYLEWQHLNTRLHCASYFLIKVLNPLMTGETRSPEKIMAFESRMSKSLDDIENIWLKNTPFLVGSEISIADIVGACEVEQVRMAGFDPWVGRPRLEAWMKRVQDLTSPYYQEAHAVLNKIANNAKDNKTISKL